MTDPRPFKKFRIKSIEGPYDRGTLNQFHDFVFEIELDPGGGYKTQPGKVGVRFFDTAYFALATDDTTLIPFDQQAKARATHYVIEVLRSLLQTSGRIFPLSLQPTVEQVQSLGAVDVTKVEESGWKDVPVGAPSRTNHIFISCGQSSSDEIALGNTIAARAKERTGLVGFFAQNQQSLDGLTREVFNRLHDAAAFIAVMHRRDQLPGMPPAFRGSVWVEQEIAIAAFVVQSLGLTLPSRAYVQRGIRREGVRGFIILNPVEFESSDEVISDLETFWPQLMSAAPSLIRFKTHQAVFSGSPVPHYFLTVANLQTQPIELTHIWYEDASHHIDIQPRSRMLPKRLEVNEVWETWLPVGSIPEEFRNNAYDSFRVRLSTGDVSMSSKDDTVPPIGTIPGGGIYVSDIEDYQH